VLAGKREAVWTNTKCPKDLTMGMKPLNSLVDFSKGIFVEIGAPDKVTKVEEGADSLYDLGRYKALDCG